MIRAVLMVVASGVEFDIHIGADQQAQYIRTLPTRDSVREPRASRATRDVKVERCAHTIGPADSDSHASAVGDTVTLTVDCERHREYCFKISVTVSERAHAVDTGHWGQRSDSELKDPAAQVPTPTGSNLTP